MDDLISRQAAIDLINVRLSQPCKNHTSEFVQGMEDGYCRIRSDIKCLPSAQPDPLSDAYMKAVWTWLLNYQVKVAELQGKYTPYEVMSWVVNDWRKEHG